MDWLSWVKRLFCANQLIAVGVEAAMRHEENLSLHSQRRAHRDNLRHLFELVAQTVVGKDRGHGRLRRQGIRQGLAVLQGVAGRVLLAAWIRVTPVSKVSRFCSAAIRL